ncbi:MAG TPA: NADP-dependent oxidoreductase [Planctomycetota bacterium]|nr:NADP-dependent oxidoreductase [Planctomycetota bacterium]
MRAVMKKTRPPSAPGRAPAVPALMRAAAIDAFGDPSAIAIRTVPVPALGANEVLIAIDTAGVARWDADMRQGWVPEGERARFPLVLGTDGSGIVVAKGARARRFDVGDRVFAAGFLNPFRKGGFHAELVAVAAGTTARIPSTLDLRRAGAIPITGCTALQGIDRALGVEKGETVAIHGASGGVGTLALQFAKARGARVFATASGDDGVELVLGLGADMAVDGKQVDLEDAARAFAPDGFDAALILAGGDAQKTVLGLVRSGGRAAYPNGVEPAPRKRKGLRLASYDGDASWRELERLARVVDAEAIDVPIAASFPLDHAARAHERLEGRVLGKVVLVVR